MHIVCTSESSATPLHLLYAITENLDRYCDVDLNRISLSNKITQRKDHKMKRNTFTYIVMNYRPMSGANIRMCILTVYNCILLI